MRDHRIDTARGLLILGVVTGHFLERSSGWDSGILRAALTALYLFHMPAFVFLTGYVAKANRIGKRVAELVSILIVFQIAFVGFTYLAGHGEKHWYWPYWVLWYIMALIWWQLALPAVKKWPRTAMTAAVLVAIVAGYLPWHGNWFTYERTLVFSPFFVAGALWGPQIMAWARRARTPLITTALFFIGAGIVFSLQLEPHWFFQNWTYSQLDIGALRGPAGRVAILALGAAGTIMVLAFTPARSRILERLGQHTLSVFLFHGFFLLAYGWWIAPHLEGAPSIILLGGSLMSGAIITLACATPHLATVATWVRRVPSKLTRAKQD